MIARRSAARSGSPVHSVTRALEWDGYEYDDDADTDVFYTEDDDGNVAREWWYPARHVRVTPELMERYFDSLKFWLATQYDWRDSFKAA